VKLRNLENGQIWFIVLLIISWGGDSAGYFAGRFLKRFFPYRLFPIVSPDKTWVGSISSMLISVVFVFLCDYIFDLKAGCNHLLIISVAGNIFSQLGDLFESFIKRTYKVKDSGFILPGHGGVLDKLDGVILTIPFFYWYLNNFLISG